MDAMESTSHVVTEKPVPYMRQLCKHFGHKNEASYTETEGAIRFPYGHCGLRAAEASGELILIVGAEDEESLERMERVIGSHLERFGSRDGLEVKWQRPG